MDVIERFKSDIAGSPRGRIAEVAAGSGVTLKTLRNLLYGYTKDLRHSTAVKLIEFYSTQERRVTPDRRREQRL